ncbi:MAG TPA: hypothetical protein VEF89_02350 [Solirubrobacteraceae bacterium]|nr:hypothetical protein [Solirubrobacteraceae bacterium]
MPGCGRRWRALVVVIVLLVAAVILAAPTLASAHRPASRAEKAAMLYRAGSHYDHIEKTGWLAMSSGNAWW